MFEAKNVCRNTMEKGRKTHELRAIQINLLRKFVTVIPFNILIIII